nr:hypothetical protein GCM10020093_098080 [Planobispora longispora]
MAVAVLLVLGLVAAWSVLIPGVSAWENIIVALIGSLRLTGPVAAAFAAWVAVRRRRGTGGRALTPWQAVRAPLAILVVVMGSFTATVLVLAVKTMLTEQAGRLLPSGLVMSVAGLALYVTIGWVTGWLLPGRSLRCSPGSAATRCSPGSPRDRAGPTGSCPARGSRTTSSRG